MIRVLQFADVINRYDFIDNIVRQANTARFEMGVCIRTEGSNIQPPLYDSSTPRWVLNGVSRRQAPRAAWQLALLLRRWQADILHTHHFDQAVIGTLAIRLYPRTKLVVGRHYSDAIYRSARGWKQRALLGIEAVVNRCATRIIVPSSFIQDLLVRRQRVPVGKVSLVPYGFDPEKYLAPNPSEIAGLREELGLGSRFCVATFARLHEEKGLRFLISAARELSSRIPECVFLLVGEGPERANLERQIDEANLGDRVRLLGWRKDVPVLMSMADVVVQPTLQEAFSQTMVEALWFSKPLVATDVSGASDVIRDGENGLLIPTGEVGAIVDAVQRLHDEVSLRNQLAASAHASVSDRLSMRNVIGRYEAVYSAALGR